MKVKKDYNKELVKRGELLIDPSLFRRKTRKEADHTSISETSSSF